MGGWRDLKVGILTAVLDSSCLQQCAMILSRERGAAIFVSTEKENSSAQDKKTGQADKSRDLSSRTCQERTSRPPASFFSVRDADAASEQQHRRGQLCFHFPSEVNPRLLSCGERQAWCIREKMTGQVGKTKGNALGSVARRSGALCHPVQDFYMYEDTHGTTRILLSPS